MKVKARSTNKPAPDAAAAFAKLLSEAQKKRHELKIVRKKAA